MTKRSNTANKRSANMAMTFNRFAKWTAQTTGHPSSFIVAFSLIVAWALTGPVFRFSDTWQLVINTTTTIVTFLMVFLIQNTQNRDSEAMQVKVDELIRAISGARNSLLNLEDMDEEEVKALRENYIQLAEAARKELTRPRRRPQNRTAVRNGPG